MELTQQLRDYTQQVIIVNTGCIDVTDTKGIYSYKLNFGRRKNIYTAFIEKLRLLNIPYEEDTNTYSDNSYNMLISYDVATELYTKPYLKYYKEVVLPAKLVLDIYSDYYDSSLLLKKAKIATQEFIYNRRNFNDNTVWYTQDDIGIEVQYNTVTGEVTKAKGYISADNKALLRKLKIDFINE